MMQEINGRSVRLLDADLNRRAAENRAYMMRLTRENLMRNYLLEAGLWTAPVLPEGIHGGWESPTCQLRGHFTGHWLSAAALIWHAAGDAEIRGRADKMVEELAACQEENGDGWAGSIPEKYFDWIARGKQVWAPHYTVHKTFMGLVDMYRYAGNSLALEVAEKWAKWFYDWTAPFTREQMDSILDVETGGMLEIWTELYAATGKPMYRELMRRYDRPRLFEELLKGNDPLTNMHANTTVPEILGCARAYEVTGEERYRRIVEAYWECAAEQRGSYATGGQTCGEIWSPKMQLRTRLGDKAQEHCVVYNMMRLAGFLLEWTKDAKYADYIERNLYNGIMAQGSWQFRGRNGLNPGHPEKGLLTYFLPMRGGDVKGWGTETTDFFCCHGTLVQANAILNRYMYYVDGNDLYICQYFDSDAEFTVDGKKVTLRQRIDTQSGSFHMGSDSPAKQAIGEVTSRVPHDPDALRACFEIVTDGDVELRIHVRVPFWATENRKSGGFRTVEKTVWKNGDRFEAEFPHTVWCDPLPDDPEMAAFMYGPVTLAGLCDAEMTLHTAPADAAGTIRHEDEREWGSWTQHFITTTEDRAIRFIPLHEVGYEKYSVYFRMKG